MNPRPKPSSVIFAKDMELLATFYREIAELAEVFRDEDRIVLNEEGFQIVVFGIPKTIAAKFQITVPPEVRIETPIKICVPVTSIAHARAEAAKFGGRIQPKTNEWAGPGFRACDGHDPEGNVFQARENAE